MTFRSIGTLAGDVLRKSARTAERRARAFDGKPPSASGSLPMPPTTGGNEGGPTQRGGVAVGPTLCTDAPAPSDLNELPVYIAPRTGKRVERPTSREVTDRPDCELNEKAGAEAPASADREVLRQTAKVIQTTFDYGTRMRPVLSLVMASREGRTATPPQGRSPRPAVRLSLVVDNGHARSLSRA